MRTPAARLRSRVSPALRSGVPALPGEAVRYGLSPRRLLGAVRDPLPALPGAVSLEEVPAPAGVRRVAWPRPSSPPLPPALPTLHPALRQEAGVPRAKRRRRTTTAATRPRLLRPVRRGMLLLPVQPEGLCPPHRRRRGRADRGEEGRWRGEAHRADQAASLRAHLQGPSPGCVRRGEVSESPARGRLELPARHVQQGDFGGRLLAVPPSVERA